ncbi:beta-lactamase family protein [Streptomyces sp. NBC_00257]|uniref:serine hydrolase domain-containing protein n=1 Tax=unclassified Streptomyces TaxID=2593676 RepID=UPI002259771E|nr:MULTISPECIES: serine hydrolase domain-containing protein [unclassified Streptomyces]WTB55105.1 beta-lactamase family protein [Streptomyces sp. NBC_00826]WTH92010.1 beta-lactamase family protein [Streptomyces sp. NBC_00825]WTI00738.1 beta-lactamase family protein [Streptomyces sp. NBC_00822]MCX4866260.1 beta-lactamase family protein [Streptomyces sp. NBC_00906]MCX4897498.1 beta-lactamase family protein [Streptomyces sp. NBC_00892]
MTRSHTRLRRGAAAAAAAGLLAVTVPVGAAWPETVPTPSVSASSTPSASPASPSEEFPPLTPAVAKRLDQAVRQVMGDARVPGVTVGLWVPGKGSYVRAFGVADKSSGAPMSTGLNMRVGSVTKTFTVTALLTLVDQGKVGLDDPIGKYVKGVPDGDRITLRELAGMRSGLFNYSMDPDFFKALTSDPQRPFTPQELLDYSFKHPLQFQPGEKFEYSNTNAILLGLVVEKASGRPLADYLERNVFEPAGMNHTFLPRTAAFPAPHAQGYTDQTASGRTGNATNWNPSWAWAAGGAISDQRDLRTWARVLATGTLLSPATQAERLRMGPSGLPDTGYGLGIFDVHGWVGHNGSLPGYESLVVHMPDTKATLVVLLNTDTDFRGSEPSTLFGEAITRVVTPQHVYTLPAQPAGR